MAVETTPHDARPLHVLAVDDNVDAADSMAMLLRLSGHEVRVAHNGLKALELVGASRPDVVLLDIGLPGLDGFQVLWTVPSAQPTRAAMAAGR